MKSSIFLCLLFILTSFQKKTEVTLILKNDSEEKFNKIEVNILGGKYSFTDLKASKKTVAIKVEKTYRYCYAKVITEKDTLISQPEDFVGEQLITKGKYVMKFKIVTQNGKRYLIIKK